MKKIFIFILALAASAGTVFAQSSGTCGKDGDNLTWTLSTEGTLTISGTGAMADYSNTNPWYDNRSSIKSVVIEAGVTSIGKYAFYNCDNLTSVTIPGSVTSIGNYAFNKCSSLASVTIPEGVISIGPRAFQNCTSLTSIALPEGITSIGIRTFYQCTSLRSVTIPASVNNIGDEAFSDCNAMTTITCKATTPPTCASNSFYAVTKSIPVYVPNVDAYTAASVWSSFTNIQEIPPIASGTCGKEGDNLTWKLSYEGVLTISGTGAMADWTTFPDVPWYSNRSSIKSVVIEDGVTSIGENAFAYCTNLTSVSLPNSVTSMGWCAFTNCNALTSFTIPKSITSIYGAFIECLGLTSIIVESGNTKYDSRDNCNAIIETATNTLIQGCKNTIIPYSVTSIGGWAFGYCTGLTSIEIPNSVTSIGYGAFEGCSGLTSITCEALTPPTCGTDCFHGIETTIPVYVPNVDAYTAAPVWNSFTNIQSLYVAYGTCGAEGDGSNLTWTLSKEGVLTISGTGEMKDWMWSFETPWADYLSSIKSLVINDGVTSLGKSAFEGCTGLTSVTIPAGITNIRTWAFNKCSGLTSFEVAKDNPNYCAVDGVLFNKDQTMLVQYPIGNTRTEYTIPNGVTTIRQCAFGYSVLTSVTIPSSVTDVGPSAFYKCSGLTSITCEATTPPTCGDNCFNAVDKSIPVNVPDGTVEDYKAKAGWKEFTNIQSGGKKFDGYKSLTIDGKERKYWLYVPEGLPANSPLVITCHEIMGTGKGQRNNSGWSPEFAIAENIVIAYPDGIANGYHPLLGSYTNGWNMSGMTDVNFMLAIVDSVKKEYNIDATRVYMSGFNIGGEFVYYVANKAADKFAAFVPISGCQTTPDATAGRPVPIFHVQGTEDFMYYQYAEACINAWVVAQHCDPAVTTKESGFECNRYKNGDGDTEIVFCVKNGGNAQHYPDANKIIWNFCKQYTTKGKVATGVESIQQSAVSSQKIIRNGQLLIERDGKTYTVTGQEIR